ncbi:MAG: hypothetical protein KAV87_48165, partial [Desulfobacteraceae bacterium]|nr:hypothetical protein [Desulfobacteraceae bacterium]
MFGLSKKPKLEIDHTFDDGSRFTSDKKGERRYYPLYGGPNTSSSYIASAYLEWVDTHPEAALVSMTIPAPYRINHTQLFSGPATFRMLFTETQKAKVAEFFDQLEARIEQEKESAARSKADHIQQAKRREVVEKQITVLIDGETAAISCDD